MNEQNIMRPYNSVASTETRVRNFNVAIIVIAVLTTIVTIYRRALNVTSETNTLVAVMEGILGIGQFVVVMLSLIFFMVFIYRSHNNLRVLGAEKLEFTPGWCIGWFFIPVMNLFKPYKAVSEIWVQSMPHSTVVPGNTTPSMSLIAWWWAFWLISNFSNYTVFRIGLAEGMVNTPFYDILYTISDGTSIISSIFIIKLVTAIRCMQENRFRELQTEVPSVSFQEGNVQ